MSLINDALRRAKEAQDQKAPAEMPELRFRQPVAPPPNRHSPAWLMVAIACAVASLAGIIFFALQRSSDSMRVTAAPAVALNENQQLPSTKADAAIPDVSNKQDEPNLTDEPAPAKKIMPASTQEAAPAAAVAQPASTTDNSKPSVASQPGSDPHEPPAPVVSAPVAAVPPKPPEPKLQGIFYNPTRPSAMINGRTVFVGGKVGELTVIAIDQQSATLAGAGRTNVLSLTE